MLFDVGGVAGGSVTAATFLTTRLSLVSVQATVRAV